MATLADFPVVVKCRSVPEAGAFPDGAAGEPPRGMHQRLASARQGDSRPGYPNVPPA